MLTTILSLLAILTIIVKNCNSRFIVQQLHILIQGGQANNESFSVLKVIIICYVDCYTLRLIRIIYGEGQRCSVESNVIHANCKMKECKICTYSSTWTPCRLIKHGNGAVKVKLCAITKIVNDNFHTYS